MADKRQPGKSNAPAGKPNVPAKVEEEKRSGVPSFIGKDETALAQYGAQGTEDIGREDMDIPRLKLLQGLSPELQTDDSLRAGMYYHTALAEGRKPPLYAVVVFWAKRYVLWNPRDAGGGILARADDAVHWQPANATFKVKLDRKDGGAEVIWKTKPTVAESGLDRWGSMNPADDKSPPAATLSYDLLLAFPGEPDWMPAVFSFQRSSIGQGRKLLTKLKTIRRPLFGTVWEWKSFVDSNSRNDQFYNTEAVAAGPLSDERLLEEYSNLNASLREKGFVVKPEEDADVGGEESGPGGHSGRPSY